MTTRQTISIPELGFENGLKDFFAYLDFYADTRVFIKDLECRYVFTNKAYADFLGTTPEAMVGRSDFDFYERNLADLYLAEDRKTLAGERFVNQRWMVPDGRGVIAWCISHKFPLRDHGGKIRGIFGTFRDLEMAGAEARPFFDLAEVVQHIHNHYAEEITAQQLADLLGLSVSQSNRRFSKTMGKSPIRYLLGVRIDHAAEMLIKTDEPITDICYACGFNSQTYFNRQFKALTGQTPKQYRARYG